MTRFDIAERSLWDAGRYLHRELPYCTGEQGACVRAAILLLGQLFQHVSLERQLLKRLR